LFEDQTSTVIEKRMLANVSDSLDKREGSIIYDATAPASIEIAEAYIMADAILTETFATTASRTYLVKRAAEYNVTPKDATYAIVKGQFNEAISIGTRFNSGTINFKTTSLLDNDAHTYKLTCETAGTAGNFCSGNITPVTNISGLTSAKILEVITPGEAEEDTETFRTRYFNTLKSQAYGGNGADYQEKLLAINGVGGTKVYRCWNGGGTVKCVILDSDYSVPTKEFISELQEEIDPTSESGQGYGIAPIGHTVTVEAAAAKTINIAATITCKTGTTIADVKSPIETTIKSYFTDLSKTWCSQSEKEFITVRSSLLLSHMLDTTGVDDVAGVTVNSDATKCALDTNEIPVLGTLTLTEGT
jgi:uncharacterized phage protein gp47/JayE